MASSKEPGFADDKQGGSCTLPVALFIRKDATAVNGSAGKEREFF